MDMEKNGPRMGLQMFLLTLNIPRWVSGLRFWPHGLRVCRLHVGGFVCVLGCVDYVMKVLTCLKVQTEYYVSAGLTD